MEQPCTNSASATTVIFLHIPKTGGTTLRHVLEKRFPADSTFLIYGPDIPKRVDELRRLPDEKKRRIRLLEGHMPFGVHELLPQPCTYITMLRDPVDRIISHYCYVLRTPDHYLHATVTSKQMSLREYVTSGISTEMDNDQTRLLSGMHDVRFGQCSEEMLLRAKRNLKERFCVAGVLDRFDETLILMKRAFRWRVPLYVKQYVTANRPDRRDISCDALRAIERQNQLDAQLCTHVRESLEERIREVNASFAWELRAFRTLNRAYGRMYRPVLRGAKELARRLR